jgi:minor extracellular serine protease Vpr
MKRLFALLILASFGLLAEKIPGSWIVLLEGLPMAVLQSQAGVQTPKADALRRMESAQAEAAAQVSNAGGRVKAALQTTLNALLVDMDDAAAQRMRSMPGVRSVIPDYEVTLHLDRATRASKVQQAWQRIGGQARAGAGRKIAVIDTGIDVRHPGFQNSGLSMPEGFPRFRRDSDRAFTSEKVIVARSYDDLQNVFNPTADDLMGHGTFCAMEAAGQEHDAPWGEKIVGVAPGAWLGNYKVFPGGRRGGRFSAILAAINDAVADGMDVLSMSLGSWPPPPAGQDAFEEALLNAQNAGVLVVASAGNDGPELGTIASPASLPFVLTVGGLKNERRVGTGVSAANGSAAPLTFEGLWGEQPAPVGNETKGRFIDATRQNANGLLCTRPAADAFAGRIVLILRGTCTFEDKLNNAELGGAVGAVVYTDAARPEAIIMASASAVLPAVMLSNADGLQLKQRIADNPDNLEGSVFYTGLSLALNPNLLYDFGSRGPNLDYTLKPEITATAQFVSSATQRANPDSDMYDRSGYTTQSGTSFSAPLVAGAAAVLKAQRPSSTPAQLRSQLIQSASPVELPTLPQSPRDTGAGRLDLENALRATATVTPDVVSYTRGTAVPAARTLSITNTSGAAETWVFSVRNGNGSDAPSVEQERITIAPGETGRANVRWTATTLAGGEYTGWITMKSEENGTELRVPYWYGVPTELAADVVFAPLSTTPRRGQPLNLEFKVLEASGLPLTSVTPRIITDTVGLEADPAERIDSDLTDFWRIRLRTPFVAIIRFTIEVGEYRIPLSLVLQ